MALKNKTDAPMGDLIEFLTNAKHVAKTPVDAC
jgi:hypothetical protein